MSAGNHIAQHHVAIADAITGVAATGSTLLWIMGWLPGFVSFLVGIAALTWYTVQVLDSPWWKRRKQRLHRARMRKHQHRKEHPHG